MADIKALDARLKEIGCNFRFWGRAEIRELANVLMPNETVHHCVNGQYVNGFALLVTTDQRVLLIDKRPMYLTLEDTRYDMVTEVDYNHRMMNATICVRTPNKELRFTAYNQGRLRQMFHYIQTRVMEVRQHYQQAAMQQQSQQYIDYAHQLSQPQQLAGIPATAGGASQTSQAAFPAGTAQPLHPMVTQALAPLRGTVAPVISAYTRLPMMSRQRRFLGSRAVNRPNVSVPRMYGGQRQPQA